MLTLVNVMQNLDQEGISFCCRTTYDDNAITNAVEIFNTSSGAVHFIASINDSGVREYDMERYQLCKHFRFDWPVNVSSVIHIVIYFFFLVFCTLSRAILLYYHF
uniref:Uncharacterized protein n=1 Tax=Aegilops tauschii subsp. strangulata TaxID=200361 RepID=A0A453REC7_AEGTS